MNMGKKIAGLALVVAVGCAWSLPAAAQSEFLFHGYSQVTSGTPDAVGSTIAVHGILSTVGGVAMPIALDLENYEYTVSVDLTVTAYSYSPVPFPMISITYDGGELHIYADPIVGGTAADYAAPGTFTDGELILAATVDPGWIANINDIDLNGSFNGSGAGSCDFYGGTQLDALMTAEYYFTDWNFMGTPVADPNPPYTSVPAGYHRIFDIKLTPPNDPSSATSTTWGGLKAMFD